MDTEEAIKIVGSWGRYQKFVFALVIIAGIPNGWLSIHFLLSNYEPTYRCKYSEDIETMYRNNSQLKDSFNDLVVNKTTENGDVSNDGCLQYDINASDIVRANGSLILPYKVDRKIDNCAEGYTYDLQRHQRSAVSEFSMICNNDWLVPVAVSLYNVGNGIGSLSAWFGDKFGRRPIFITSAILHILSGVAIATSWNVVIYLLSNLFCGAAGQFNFLTTFVLASEVTDASNRNFMAIAAHYSYAMGYASVGLFGYFIQDWRWYLGFASGFSFLLYLPVMWFIPETVRWLVQNGRTKDASDALKKISKINRTEKEFHRIKDGSEMKTVSKEVELKKNLHILFRSGIGVRCVVLLYNWLAVVLVYNAVTIFSKRFSPDRFLNIFFGGIAEIPGHFACYQGAKILGRARTAFIALTTSTTSLFILTFLPEEYTIASTIVSIIGKGAVTAALYSCYILSLELVPTLQRSTNASLGSAAGRIGSFAAPYVMYIGKVNPILPTLIMGSLSLVSSLLTLIFIPETKDIPMPENIEEARNIKSVIGLNICKKLQNDDTSSKQVDATLREEQNMPLADL